jgi:hypothetical protein
VCFGWRVADDGDVMYFQYGFYGAPAWGVNKSKEKNRQERKIKSPHLPLLWIQIAKGWAAFQ